MIVKIVLYHLHIWLDFCLLIQYLHHSPKGNNFVFYNMVIHVLCFLLQNRPKNLIVIVLSLVSICLQMFCITCLIRKSLKEKKNVTFIGTITLFRTKTQLLVFNMLTASKDSNSIQMSMIPYL